MPKFNFYKFLCILLGVIILWLLPSYLCNRSKPCPELPQPTNQEKKVDKDREKYWSNRVEQLKKDSIYQESVIEEISKKWMFDRNLLNSANTTATQLVNELDKAREKKDTAKYIANCDSLSELAKRVSGRFQEYSNSTNELLKGINDARYIETQKTQTWKAKSDSLESKLKEKPLFKPRTVLLAGVGISGNQFAFRSVEVGLMLKTKRDRIFGVSGDVGFDGKAYFSGRYYTPISFRKNR